MRTLSFATAAFACFLAGACSGKTPSGPTPIPPNPAPPRSPSVSISSYLPASNSMMHYGFFTSRVTVSYYLPEGNYGKVQMMSCLGPNEDTFYTDCTGKGPVLSDTLGADPVLSLNPALWNEQSRTVPNTPFVHVFLVDGDLYPTGVGVVTPLMMPIASIQGQVLAKAMQRVDWNWSP